MHTCTWRYFVKLSVGTVSSRLTFIRSKHAVCDAGFDINCKHYGWEDMRGSASVFRLLLSRAYPGRHDQGKPPVVLRQTWELGNGCRHSSPSGKDMVTAHGTYLLRRHSSAT